MAVTNNTIIGDALKLLGVLGETETPSAEQGSVCLRRLNQMMEQWTENDIELGWFEQSLTTDSAPIPKWAEKGVTSKLAQDLQPLYPSSSLEQWVFDDMKNGYGTIARRAMLDNLKGANLDHMPVGEGSYGNRVNIETEQ